jgi:ABC-type lipoprotein export system ATPase subunit
MITHEFDIAKYASRLIHIRDGKINYDGRMPRDDKNL